MAQREGGSRVCNSFWGCRVHAMLPRQRQKGNAPAAAAAPLQREAHLGVSASVHSGNLVCGGNSHSVHSKQGVMPGISTLQHSIQAGARRRMLAREWARPKATQECDPTRWHQQGTAGSSKTT